MWNLRLLSFPGWSVFVRHYLCRWIYNVSFAFLWWIVFWCLVFTAYFYLGIAGLAPLASHSFATAQKSDQKRPPLFVCPEKNTRGSWLLRYCLRARLDAPSGRTRLNSPSLANLLYQYRRIQQTKEGVKNKKRKNKTNQTKAYFEIYKIEGCTVFDFDLQSTSASHLASIVIMGFLCQHVWAYVPSNVGEFWRSMIMIPAKWVPLCLLQGRSWRGGPFWLLFVAVDKE